LTIEPIERTMKLLMPDVLIRVRALRKEFAGNPVLRDVDAEIRKGEILGLIGENGAGKSTFMKILAGIHQATSGVLELDGRVVSFQSPSQARRAGVSLVPQEFNLAADLSVEENVFLGAEMLGPGRLLDRVRMRARAAELLAELGASASPGDWIEGLSAAQKQLVEICKALAFEARLVILDEPTTMLTRREIDRLFGVMRSLRDRGMTLVYVSHKLAEVKAICDRVLILKDGELVHAAPIAELEPAEMARRMVGRELREIYPPKRPATGPVVLEVRGLSSPGAFTDVSFTLREGELLGFAGLVGAGRTETAEALMGLRPCSGQVWMFGQELRPRSALQAVRRGLGYLSEDRQGAGILPGFGIAENLTLVSLRDYCRLAVVDRGRERAQAQTWRERFGIKAPDLGAPLESLSGGNQQKVSLAKTLDARPRVVIVDEPTRGVDVAAKQEIYRFLADLAEAGTAVLLVSSELEEIVGLCDRVVVMREGRVAGELQGPAVNEQEIMYLATGVDGGARA
jgi:ribose transport system ATP-binding protein